MAQTMHERSRFTCQSALREAAFLVAVQLDSKRFSKAEIDAGVSDVLLEALDHIWEVARGAWFNWCLWSGLGSSDDSNLNGIQEVFRSILGRQAL
jgi:hypothetical protein